MVNDKSNKDINKSDIINSLPMNDINLKITNHDREITGTVIGDRVCITCGYNLMGQPIVREQYYKMLIVRCPECATVASLQEYPLLGKWANRWAVMLAVLWFVLLLGVGWIFLQTNLITHTRISYNCGQNLSKLLVDEHAKWRNNQIDKGLPVTQPPGWMMESADNQNVDPNYLDPLWWPNQDYRKLIANNVSIGKEVLQPLLEVSFLSILLLIAIQGMVLSVMLIHIKRRYLLLLLPILVSTYTYFNFAHQNIVANISNYYYYSSNWTNAGTITPFLMQEYVFYCVQPLIFLSFVIGIYTGRKSIRLTLRYLLPPKFLAPFAYLWTVEGLVPPRPFK